VTEERASLDRESPAIVWLEQEATDLELSGTRAVSLYRVRQLSALPCSEVA
jgi:hypothetical protein